MANVQQAPITPALAQDPNYVAQMMQAQRMQQMAEALTQQGMAPIQYDHSGAISWKQGVAKLLNAYLGNKMAGDAIGAQADARSQGMQSLVGAMTPQQFSPQQAQAVQMQDASQAAMNAPGNAGAGPTVQAAQQGQQIAAQMGAPTTTSRAAPLNPAGWNPQFAAIGYTTDPSAYLKAQAEAIAPTNDMKNWQAQGINPGQLAAGTLAESAAKGKTPEIINAQYMGKTPQQMLAAALAGDAKNAEIERKPGNQFVNPYLGTSGMVPKIPEYANPVGGVAPNGAIPGGVAPMPGALPIAAAITGANQRAKDSNSVFTGVPGPNGAPQSGFGSDLFQNVGSATPGPDLAQLIAADAQANGIQNPVANFNFPRPGGVAQLSTAGAAPTGPAPNPRVLTGPDPTVQAGRVQQQTDMGKKWGAVNDAAGAAQAVNSRLDNITDLASRASTGQFADRLQFVNSILSMAGSDKATDANTAKVLLDKNANQIVAQLGQGGLATDAARAILQSAYPNSHMPQAAITEAAANLKAANSMSLAKARVLQPHYVANNPAAYQQVEQQFNSAADPRIFQWRSMSGNPTAQAAFAKQLAAQDPSIMDKIRTLTQIGALE